jgi:hypothetical protein
MARCPLCEHEQAIGDTCDVCGRERRTHGAAAAGPMPALEGLEATGHALVAPRSLAAADAPLAGLEPTRAAALPPLRGPPEPWVEATLAAEAAVVVEPLDVERTAGDGERSPDPALRTCRHCGELVPEGEVFCLRCARHVERWPRR